MKQIKKILAEMDSDPTSYVAYEKLQDDLEVAVRAHVLDLEEAVVCLRVNLRSTRVVTGVFTDNVGIGNRIVVDIRDVERLEQL